MRGLKKFVMGEKDWSYEFPTTRAILQQDEYADINQEDVEWLHTDNRHRTFACSEPESFGERPRKPYRFDPEEPKDLRLDKYLHGFSSRDGVDWAPEEEVVGPDDAAYALLMEGIRDRLRS
ncbi:hypothetical protein NW765_013720 [Fusarium oxysporum]|nr:hypothetical protein NW765_013720 [Fusarium oxysporum]KAJ4278052.1 hypothetical protein NW764_008085 [Fusarium oxysporum]